MPNTEVIQRWVEALESGDYPQTIGTLHRNLSDDPDVPVGYCCLGVLCDLAVREGIIREHRHGSYSNFGSLDDESESGLPERVMEWAGFDGSYPEVYVTAVGHTPRYTPLVELNDTHGWDFGRIAAVIREEWLSNG